MKKFSKVKLAKLASRALLGQPKATQVVVKVKKKNQRQKITLKDLANGDW